MIDPYPSEKFDSARRHLVVSANSLQQRIGEAFVYYLDYLLRNGSVPAELAKQLASYDTGRDGQAWETWAASLSDDDASNVARWIDDAASSLNATFWLKKS